MKMRGSKRNMLLAGILLLAMAGIGHGYASWNREQSISMELATGKFKHFFSQKGDCSAEIVDEAGNELQSIASDWKTMDNRTTAEISFREGLPMELLAEGNYLCLSYPIEKNGTVVRLTEADFTKEAEQELTLEPKDVFLSAEGTLYRFDEADDFFKKPLVLAVYRAVEESEDGELRAKLYLKPQSEGLLEGMPEELKIKRGKLAKIPIIGDAGPMEEGIQVVYSLEVPIRLDQANAEKEAEEVER